MPSAFMGEETSKHGRKQRASRKGGLLDFLFWLWKQKEAGVVV